MIDFKKLLREYVLFEEPEKKEKFILKETPEEEKEMQDKKGSDKEKNRGVERKNEKGNLKKPSKNRGIVFKGIEITDPEAVDEEDKTTFVKKDKAANDKEKEDEGIAISKDLKRSLEYMKKVYSIPNNGDIVLREFDIVIEKKPVGAFLMFFDGMTDRMVINTNILTPLMLLSNLDIKSNEKDVLKYVDNHLLPHGQVKISRNYQEVIDEINFGGCGIFIDGMSFAFACDVKGWEHRGVDRPNTELVLRGPQEAFTEILRVNTALVRKILKDSDLIAEDISIGEKSKTACSMMYIKNIANEALVGEVRRRLKSIKVDYIQDTGELEQYIEDSTFLPTPQIIATERPDKVSSMLADGKVAVIMNGTPFVLVMPATFTSLIHSPEDTYVRFPYANFLRIIRIAGIILTLLLPGMYIAITNYHHEMIPTDLLLAIEVTREQVPFPSVVELLIMEFAFELIREAGIRIPGPIGPTLGIIGALILGQAAVAANIVSPILIIVVAVTGIGSFAIPTFALAFAFRLLRFAYIFLGAMAGFLGITLGIFIHGLLLLGAKSFGVPLMAPFAPRTSGAMTDGITRFPTWKMEDRADYLNPKKNKKQQHISRGWTQEDNREE